MAAGSTIYKIQMNIADMDRNYYETHKLTVAKHPSETDERLMVRLVAFAMNAGACLHVETLYGENSHHIIETCFKALARALRQAITIDERLNGEVASTKGVLGESEEF